LATLLAIAIVGGVVSATAVVLMPSTTTLLASVPSLLTVPVLSENLPSTTPITAMFPAPGVNTAV
jgi:hypothetical protein